jgi:hypothetical protein
MLSLQNKETPLTTLFLIDYRHWKTHEHLVAFGEIPEELNNNNSDRLVVKLQDGTYEDIIKSTIIQVKKV